jgi:CRISPR-associated protein Csc3
MSSDVLKGIKVQQFSNRLLGGQDEPKRHICPVCQAQFTLEKLNYKSGGKKSIYLHLMPYTFLSSVFVESLRAQFQQLRQEEITAVGLDVYEAVEAACDHKYLLPCKKLSAAGIPVPNFSEVVGNTITFPLNALGDSDVERYLSAVEYALFLHKAFGCKVLLTESSIPILSKDEMSDIFLDGIPASLRGLIPVESLNADSVERLWRDYLSLRAIYVALRTPSKENELLSLAQSFTRGRQHLFSVVDHLIESKTGKAKSPEWAASAAVHKLTQEVNEIIERGEN